MSDTASAMAIAAVERLAKSPETRSVSQSPAVAVGARSQDGGGDRPERRNHERRPQAERDAGRRERQHAQPHRRARLVSAGRGVAPGQGQERDAERLDEARHRQTAGQREPRDPEGEDQVLSDRAEARVLEEGQEREPLAHEAVERRQRGDRRRADQEARRRPRHPLDEPAHRLHVPRAGRVHDGAGAQEEQRLERRVVDGVIERRDQAEHRERVPDRRPETSAALPSPSG